MRIFWKKKILERSFKCHTDDFSADFIRSPTPLHLSLDQLSFLIIQSLDSFLHSVCVLASNQPWGAKGICWKVDHRNTWFTFHTTSTSAPIFVKPILSVKYGDIFLMTRSSVFLMKDSSFSWCLEYETFSQWRSRCKVFLNVVKGVTKLNQTNKESVLSSGFFPARWMSFPFTK